LGVLQFRLGERDTTESLDAAGLTESVAGPPGQLQGLLESCSSVLEFRLVERDTTKVLDTVGLAERVAGLPV
jgi:hypothetical protein